MEMARYYSLMRDAWHELRIRAVLAILCAADAVARLASVELKRLCTSRSARRIEQMEREKGLV